MIVDTGPDRSGRDHRNTRHRLSARRFESDTALDAIKSSTRAPAFVRTYVHTYVRTYVRPRHEK